MNIGIDFDGVIFDTERMLRAYSAFYNYKINGADMLDPEEQTAERRYDWTSEQIQQFFRESLLDSYKKAPLMYYAKEVLTYMKKQGHKIYGITRRGLIFPEEIKASEKRLKKEKIVFDKIIYSADNKAEICKQLNILEISLNKITI